MNALTGWLARNWLNWATRLRPLRRSGFIGRPGTARWIGSGRRNNFSNGCARVTDGIHHMILAILVISFFAWQLLCVTVRGREAWPFSHYPMFAQPHTLAQVEVFRVARETADGEIIWWRSRFYRYPERLGRDLRQAQTLAQHNAALPLLEQRRLLAEAARLIRLEEGGASRYRALRIVRRTAAFDRQQQLVVGEETIATVSFDSLPPLRGDASAG